MATLLMFAAIREAAGVREMTVNGRTVGEVLDAASATFGADFDRLLPYCMVLVDNDSAGRDLELSESSEIALLPPVSGGQ